MLIKCFLFILLLTIPSSLLYSEEKGTVLIDTGWNIPALLKQGEQGNDWNKKIYTKKINLNEPGSYLLFKWGVVSHKKNGNCVLKIKITAFPESVGKELVLEGVDGEAKIFPNNRSDIPNYMDCYLYFAITGPNDNDLFVVNSDNTINTDEDIIKDIKSK